MVYTRNIGESEEEFIFRVCKDKDLIGTWEDVANILNKQLGNEYTESKYRKQYQAFCKMFEKTKEQYFDEKYIKDLEEKEETLFKQQVKAADRLRELRGDLRKEARYEALVDAVRECASNMPEYDLDYRIEVGRKNEAVLLLSDWHAGITVNNFRRKFNMSVLVESVAKIKSKVIKYCEINDVRRLNVCGLGDFISGNIHVSTRVQQETDVISQTMFVAELMAEFLKDLSLEIEQVIYRQTLDNHSRTNLNYKDHIEVENFSRIIPWYLETRLADTCVHISNDNIDPNIGYFETQRGKKVCFVHGHLDKPKTVIDDLTSGIGVVIDYVMMGHYHSKESGDGVFVNGSIVGTDAYALNNRLFSTPSQTLIIFENDGDVIDITVTC